jgi:asparagine synthase (glutamine-hydrolysing)
VDAFEAEDHASLEWELPGALLVKMDMATMAHGLEARSPFLDHNLTEWAWSLSPSLRASLRRTKPMLRDAATSIFGSAFAAQPKRGFEPPIYEWLSGPLAPLTHELILASNGLVRDVVEKTKLEQLLKEESISRRAWTGIVWSLLALAAWDRLARPRVQHFGKST